MWIVTCVVLVGAIARADRRATPKPESIVGRVVDLEVSGDTSIVTVLAGSERGIGKSWHAKFREGTTTKLLAGGEATNIRIDHRTTTLRTSLAPEQVRAHRFVQFDP